MSWGLGGWVEPKVAPMTDIDARIAEIEAEHAKVHVRLELLEEKELRPCVFCFLLTQLKAAREALKLTGPHLRTDNEYTTSDHDDFHLMLEKRRAALSGVASTEGKAR